MQVLDHISSVFSDFLQMVCEMEEQQEQQMVSWIDDKEEEDFDDLSQTQQTQSTMLPAGICKLSKTEERHWIQMFKTSPVNIIHVASTNTFSYEVAVMMVIF